MGNDYARTLVMVGRCPECQGWMGTADDDGWQACACGRRFHVDTNTTPPTITERMPVPDGFRGCRVDAAPSLKVVIAGETVDLDRDDLGIAEIPAGIECFEIVWS
jgi:hypothetical protein